MPEPSIPRQRISTRTAQNDAWNFYRCRSGSVSRNHSNRMGINSIGLTPGGEFKSCPSGRCTRARSIHGGSIRMTSFFLHGANPFFGDYDAVELRKVDETVAFPRLCANYFTDNGPDVVKLFFCSYSRGKNRGSASRGWTYTSIWSIGLCSTTCPVSSLPRERWSIVHGRVSTTVRYATSDSASIRRP